MMYPFTWLQAYQTLLNAFTPEQASTVLTQARETGSATGPIGRGSVTVNHLPANDTFDVIFAAPLFA